MKTAIGKKKDINEVMAIVQQWPTSFTPEAYDLIRTDFCKQKSFVSRNTEKGKIVGFVIFSTNAYEVELIWMAVDKNGCRHGIATNLVEEVISSMEQQKIIIAKVSGEKNKRAGTKLDGSFSLPVRKLFENLQFEMCGLLKNYWGEDEDCLVYKRAI